MAILMISMVERTMSFLEVIVKVTSPVPGMYHVSSLAMKPWPTMNPPAGCSMNRPTLRVNVARSVVLHDGDDGETKGLSVLVVFLLAIPTGMIDHIALNVDINPV